MNDRLRYRLGLRSSNAARPHRNHAREAKTGQKPWELQEFRDWHTGEESPDFVGDEENDDD